MSLRDEVNFTISKERFEDFIAPFLEAWMMMKLYLSSRPREGDLFIFLWGKDYLKLNLLSTKNHSIN
jgi:hypothetical protein